MKTFKNTLTVLLITFISINVDAQKVVEETTIEENQKEGCVEGDCENGFGTKVFNKEKYIGNWKSGNPNGQGTWVYNDNSKTSGNWNDGFQEGIFEVFNVDGTLSHREVWGGKGVGLIKPGCAGDCENGFGTYIWEDGNRYDGNWQNGKKHGQGNLFFFNGDKYSGGWDQDTKSGNADYIWKDGSFYRGEYINDMMNGKGKYYDKDGYLIRTGTWINDEYQVGETGCLSGNCENGTGTYLWENGQKYEGEWKNSQMNGTGTYYLENGEIYHKGQWKDHQKVD